MKATLFIGHHKVGSTALQDYLWRNAALLLRQEVLYPATESEGAALMLRQALTGQPDHDGLPPAPFNAREAHNALAFRLLNEAQGSPIPPWHPQLPSGAQMLVGIENQIRHLAPAHLLLCSEVFANFGTAGPGPIQRVARVIYGAEVTVCCTLRRPDEYLASWHAQRLRFGHVVPPLSDGGVAAHAGTIHLDYRRILDGWLAAFPGQVSIRNYAEVLAAGGSIPDFLAQAGLTPPAIPVADRAINGSIHPALSEFARAGNRFLPRPLAQRYCEFLIVAADDLPVPPRSDVEPFGPAARADLLARFAPVADWLDGLRGAAFFPDLDEAARCRPIPLVEAARSCRAALIDRIRAAGLPAELLDFTRTAEIA